MHERLFHGNEISKSTRNVSNILYEEAKKNADNRLLHFVLNDDEFLKAAKEKNYSSNKLCMLLNSE